jgi:UrcA family protein
MRVNFDLRIVGCALAVVSTMLCATAPIAAKARVEAPAVVVMRVPYHDLDLATAAGIESLRARVRLAASRLCVAPGVRSDDQRRADAECRTALIDAAEAQISAAAGAAPNQEAGRGQLTLARGR